MADVANLETQKKNRYKRSRTKQFTVSNRFASIAPVWFYSLIRNFVQRKGEVALWSGSTGSRLLAGLFFTLALIVEFSCPSPTARVLSRDLFELVWPFRVSDVADVRHSVLVAVAASFALLPEEIVLLLLLDDANLSRALTNMARNDPDAQCRMLASSISRSVLDTLDSLQLFRPRHD